MEEVKNNKCKKCGDCCRNGPPTLHKEDVGIYRSGVLQKKSLITYRKGELIYDNVRDVFVVLDQEIVKLKSKQNEKECIFLDSCICSIYEARPVECRIFNCWDIKKFLNFYEKNRAQRLDFIPKDSALAEIIFEHENRCSVEKLLKLVEEFKKEKKEKVLKDIHTILDQDVFFRDYLIKAGADEKELDFVFGRRLSFLVPPEIMSLLDI